MLLSATFSILWFLCGLVAVISMFLMLGSTPEPSSIKRMRWIHRIFGGIFSIGYLFFLFSMIPKYNGNAPFLPAGTAAHAYLGAALLPVLFMKHYIVRKAKKYFTALPYVGMVILAMAFVVVAMTGVHHIILWTRAPKITVQSTGGPRTVSTAVGRNLLAIKCSTTSR